VKTLEYYLSLPYKLELVPDAEEGGYVASWPELRGCMTCGDSIEAVIANAADCKREWLMSALDEGLDIPEPSDAADYSGQFKLRIPKSLHKALAERSRTEGISMNQYCLYLLTKNDAEQPRLRA